MRREPQFVRFEGICRLRFFCIFVLELICVKFAIYHAEKIFRNLSELIDIIRKTRIFLKGSYVITRPISRLLHVVLQE